MKVINMSAKDSVLNQFLAELRDVNIQKDRMRFRRNLERIGELQAFEISKTLNYSEKSVQTPLGLFLNVFDKAGAAFVSAYRCYKDKECRQVDVHIEYIASPDLTGCTFMLVDPMLATGESLELAWNAFLSKGKPAKLHIACVIASPQGIEHLNKVFSDVPNVTLWCAVIDQALNERSYILPGLGDAGDLSFGGKI